MTEALLFFIGTVFNGDQVVVALDILCTDCEGCGETYDIKNKFVSQCRTCGGSGYILTEAGKTLRAFVHRHALP